MAQNIGPRQAGKKGNEKFGAEDEEVRRRPPDVSEEKAGRDVSDEEAGVAGILRKADDESRPALTEHGSEEARQRGYVTPPET